MDEITLGIIIGVLLLIVMLSGMPIAFSLGIVSLGIIYFLLGPLQYDLVPEIVFGSLNDFALLAIPLFILMGVAFAKSQASTDLYEAIRRWLYKLPGGLAISSIVASGIFAALCGSSPATAAAIGTVGVPEMRKRGYPPDLATGCIAAGGTLGILIPPSVTMILYGICVEQSIGQLFAAGFLPGFMLVVMFSIWAGISWKVRTGKNKEMLREELSFTWSEKMKSLAKVWTFVALILIVLGSLYAGFATPSEAAGVGAIVAIILISIVYKSFNLKNLQTILMAATKESTMILLIIGMAAFFGYAISYLHIPQAIAQSITILEISRWWIMGVINIFLLILGFFLPPAAIIVMVSPIIHPIIVGLGWDPIWFGVIMTLNMELGLITPPVGLNLYVLQGIAPDIPLSSILWGSVPYMAILVLGIVILCIFPQIALFLPQLLFQ